MITFDRNVIYLGNIGTPSVFSAPNFVGNEYSGSNAFLTTITVNENFSNDQQVVLDTNGTNVETISYFGGTHEVFDAGYFRATVTQANGTVETGVRVGIFYTDTGDVFLNEFGENGQLDNRVISSIEIERKVSINFINADVSSNLVGTSFGAAPGSNQDPNFTNIDDGTFINVAENQTAVINTDAVDPDGDSLTNSIVGGADAGQFSIDPSSGVITFNNAPDFENPGDANGDNVYELTVQVSDGRGGTDTDTVFINVTDVDEAAPNTAPVLTNANPGEFIDVPENQIAVRNIDAFDADGDNLTFSIIGGADAARFTIDPVTGQLDFISAPDFEGENSAVGNDDIYDVTVQVSDGRGGVDTANLFINVTDVDETAPNNAPVLTNANPGEFINVPENQTAVRNIDAFDVDGDNLTFSIVGGADAARFTIDPVTGQLDFTSAPDFEGENSAIGNDDIYDVTVQVSDGRGGVDTANLFINVTDVDEGGTSPDGAVDGEDFSEVMTPGYNDANAPTNNGGDIIDGADGDDDLIFGNGGNDTIDAGAGNDVVFGDAGPGALGGGSGSSTSLDVGSLSGNTLTSADGSVTAAVDFGAPGGFGGWQAIPVGFNGARDELFFATGVLETRNSTLTLNFDAPVEDLSFTIFDVNAASWDDKVTVVGRTENGSIVPVVYTDVDDQFVNGNVIEGRSAGSRAQQAELNENNIYNVTANIAAPIVELQVIFESQEGGPSASGYIALGDFQLTPASQAPQTFQEILEAQDIAGGDDVLQGNPGSDQLWGEGGNDTILIDSAADGAGDIVVGGNGPNPFIDNDTLDLRGAGPVTISSSADATDAGAQAGTVTFDNGSTLQFFQIETILADPDNQAPDAQDDPGNITKLGEPITLDVLANDTDPDNDPLTITGATLNDPSFGVVDIVNNQLVYTPSDDAVGITAEITYTVSDGNGGTDSAVAFTFVLPADPDPELTITPASDAPIDPATG